MNIWWIILAALALWIVWRLLNYQYYGKGRDRSAIPSMVTYLARLMGNGGHLQVRPRGVAASITLVRSSGDDERAVIVAEITNGSGSEGTEALSNMLATRGFSLVPADHEAASAVKVQWEVDDIWSEKSLGAVASGLWTILDGLGCQTSDPIDFAFSGPRSRRWHRRLRQQRIESER